ncbi:MAG: hypothetical protein GY715_09925 [Planctomycetes bacterium]|nr:hypothetical protein [Planctomycetota bacterium]
MSSHHPLMRTILATTAGAACLTGAPVAHAQCVDFDPPGAGAWGCCGATFISDGVEFQTGPFTWTSGIVTAGGDATIVNACNGVGGHSLWTNNITVSPKIEHFYGVPEVRQMRFYYEDFGGNVNLRVNGLLAFSFNEFFAIPAGFFNPAGVQLITPPPVWTGSSWRGEVILEALPGHCIFDLALGGQELCVDDICANDPCLPCPDLDGDGLVGFGDVLAIIAAWGPCAGCPQDLNNDNVVGFGDILVVIGAWGPC